jgi:hypothetical protein
VCLAPSAACSGGRGGCCFRSREVFRVGDIALRDAQPAAAAVGARPVGVSFAAHAALRRACQAGGEAGFARHARMPCARCPRPGKPCVSGVEAVMRCMWWWVGGSSVGVEVVSFDRLLVSLGLIEIAVQGAACSGGVVVRDCVVCVWAGCCFRCLRFLRSAPSTPLRLHLQTRTTRLRQPPSDLKQRRDERPDESPNRTCLTPPPIGRRLYRTQCPTL